MIDVKHRGEIIRKFHRGIPVKIIAGDENVSEVTIYKWLLKWKIREKREQTISEGNTERRNSTIIPSLKERMNSELSAKIERNTQINKKYVKHYLLPEEDFWSVKKW